VATALYTCLPATQIAAQEAAISAPQTGWLVINPGLTPATERTALDLAGSQFGERPVAGVVYTRSHNDRLSGAAGVISQADVDACNVAVAAPKDFPDAGLCGSFVKGAKSARLATYLGIGVPRGVSETVIRAAATVRVAGLGRSWHGPGKSMQSKRP
jgi:alkyl sulfatase BDS1-like metallo-beta-lactamase superfamily hydrolase